MNRVPKEIGVDMDEQTFQQAHQVLASVAVLHQYLMRFFEGASKSDAGRTVLTEVTQPQFNMMRTLHEKGGATIKELAESLHVSAPSVSTMVERLVEMGMVLREHSTVDRRVVYVRLSEAGTSSFAAQEEQLLRAISEILDKLGPEMTGRLLEVHARIRDILSKELEAAYAGKSNREEEA